MTVNVVEHLSKDRFELSPYAEWHFELKNIPLRSILES